MRKIFLIILTIFLWLFGYAQFPITQNLGAPSTLVLNKGGFKTDSALVIPSYSDTTRANQSLGKTYPGNIIRVGNLVYIRNFNATGWILVGSGGGGGGSFDTVYAKYPIRVDTTGVKDTLYLAQPFLDSVYNNSPGFLDGLVSTGGVDLIDTSAIVLAPIIWKRNGVITTQNTNALFPIPRADTLNYRTDIIYISSGNVITYGQGIEDTINALAPAIPSGGILITYVNVYGSSRIVNQTASVYQRTGVLFVDLNTGQITADSTRFAWNQSNGSLIIGNQAANANPSAILQLTSNNKGFLMPTMSAALRNGISSPANGLMVYDTDSSALFYYDNTQWKKLINSFNISTLQQVTTVGDTTNRQIRFNNNGINRLSIDPQNNWPLRIKNGTDSTIIDASDIVSYKYTPFANISRLFLSPYTVGPSLANLILPVTELGNVVTVQRTLALSVNGNYADSAGNISFTSSPTTLQQVLDNNHDLVNGINLQGTGAGSGNSGSNINALGSAALENNTANNANAFGNSAGRNNTGSDINAMGDGAGNGNTYNNVNLFGYQASATNNNQTSLAGGTYQARIDYNRLTASQQYDLPDSSGTIALTSNIPDTANIAFRPTAGANIELSGTYPNITITGTGGSGGGSSINYYLNGSVNQGTFGGNTYYQLSQTPVLGAGTNFIRLNSAGNGYIASFITDVGQPNIINIPGGNWNLEFYFNASSGGGSPQFYGEIYKYDGATFTLIASGSTNPETISNGTTIDQYFTSISIPQTTLLSSDRLAVRIYVIPGGRNITLHTEDNNLSEVLTSINIPAWKTSGNADVNAGQFIGSTNNASLRFRTNNTERMVLDSTGNLTINQKTAGNDQGSNLLNFNATGSSANAQRGYIVYNGNGGTNGGALQMHNLNGGISFHPSNGDIFMTATDPQLYTTSGGPKFTNNSTSSGFTFGNYNIQSSGNLFQIINNYTNSPQQEAFILNVNGGLKMASVANNGTLNNALQLANTDNRSFFNINTSSTATNLLLKANSNAQDSMIISDSGLIAPRSNATLWLKPNQTGSWNVMANRCGSCIQTGSIFAASFGSNAPVFNVLGTGATSIGTQSPTTSSLVDMTSTSLGLLIPRMTTTQRNSISSPANQLLVANTTTNTIDMYQNSNWSTIAGDYSDDVVAYRSLGSTIQAGPVPGIGTIQASVTMFTGRGYWAAVYVKKPITITGAAWFQAVAGSYTAANYNGLALYSYSGGTLTLVDSSTRDNTIWTTTTATWGSKAFAGGTRTLAPGIYYVAAIFNNSAVTTAPQIGAVYSGTSTVGYTAPLTTNSARISGWETSITTPPTTKLMSSFSGQGIYLGLCLY